MIHAGMASTQTAMLSRAAARSPAALFPVPFPMAFTSCFHASRCIRWRPVSRVRKCCHAFAAPSLAVVSAIFASERRIAVSALPTASGPRKPASHRSAKAHCHAASNDANLESHCGSFAVDRSWSQSAGAIADSCPERASSLRSRACRRARSSACAWASAQPCTLRSIKARSSSRLTSFAPPTATVSSNVFAAASKLAEARFASSAAPAASST